MRIARALTIAALCVGLSGCDIGVLEPRGPVGEAQRQILFNALAIMLAIVVPTILAVFAFAWWFRASNKKARYRPDFEYSGQIELVVWSIPLLVILFLGGIAWVGSHDLDPGRPLASKNKALAVQVVSLDWKWLFIYPEQGIASINQLVVPEGTPLDISLTSASVMNAFFVPQLGSMIYTMNGMTSHLFLQADAPGTFEGLSSHFSGDGFAGMRFHVRATSTDDFAKWIEGARGSGVALDAKSYETLAKPSSDVAPVTYRAVEPNLFNDIATGQIAPAPGPEAGRPDSDVSPKMVH